MARAVVLDFRALCRSERPTNPRAISDSARTRRYLRRALRKHYDGTTRRKEPMAHPAELAQVATTFDPDRRACEKQASRDADARAMATGAKTVEQLRRENSFAVPPRNAVIDYRSIPRARLR